MRSGRCLCGAVRYDVRGPLREILVCHCVECRRWAGHAWAATAAKNADLEITGDVAWFPSPQSAHAADRGICRQCGASLFYRAPGRDRISIGAGTLDDPDGLRVAAHIWVEQGADWEGPPAAMPSYPRGYPDDAPPIAWR